MSRSLSSPGERFGAVPVTFQPGEGLEDVAVPIQPGRGLRAVPVTLQPRRGFGGCPGPFPAPESVLWLSWSPSSPG